MLTHANGAIPPTFRTPITRAESRNTATPSLRIAQIAPLIESVPPRHYGGTERVVSYLTEELVSQGHDVTLFASGDSMTRAHLVPCCRRALRQDAVQNPMTYHLLMLDKVRRMASQFDVLHFHIDQLHFPIFHSLGVPTVTTLHGRQDSPDLRALYAHFHDMPLVAISESQHRAIPNAHIAATVYHGLPANLLRPTLFARGGYLAFLGRISPEKGVERAIEIARAFGLTLKIAAKVDRVDEAYFEREIRPLLRAPGVEFVGEIDEHRKEKFLGDAKALLFPIDWPEPFGLVMIEAMACGTPVLAFRHGSAAEVIDEGVTGFVVEDVNQAICRMGALLALDRGRVRRQFDDRFTAARMARDYMQIYHQLVRGVRRVDRPRAERQERLASRASCVQPTCARRWEPRFPYPPRR
jgi:glycosyltransferase involved in cell wall biosynthesis